jgi:hypothetical protein
MVKVSHECPLSLLETGRAWWNDYEYALVHLFEKHPEYFDFMKKSVDLGRHVLLDCSTFELEKSYDMDRYAYWIEKLNPTEYIIPDVLEDCQATIKQAVTWNLKHGRSLPQKKIGVVQGKTYKEIVECYKYMSWASDKIAISFDYSFYNNIALGENKEEQWGNGRKELITKLVKDGIWCNKPTHLLGTGTPQSFKFFQDSWDLLHIETLDTSNPVQQGLLGHRYTEDGLKTKDKLKVADSFDIVYTEEQIEVANFNVKMFKRFCEGYSDTV